MIWNKRIWIRARWKPFCFSKIRHYDIRFNWSCLSSYDIPRFKFWPLRVTCDQVAFQRRFWDVGRRQGLGRAQIVRRLRGSGQDDHHQGTGQGKGTFLYNLGFCFIHRVQWIFSYHETLLMISWYRIHERQLLIKLELNCILFFTCSLIKNRYRKFFSPWNRISSSFI